MINDAGKHGVKSRRTGVKNRFESGGSIPSGRMKGAAT